MKKMTLTTLFIVSTFVVLGQTEATTKDGKKVLLHENGTWEYIKEEKEEPEKTVEKTSKPTTSHDCNYNKKEIDEFTGDKKIVLEPQKIAKKKYYKLYAYLARVGDQRVVYLNYYRDMGCASYDSYAIFKFADGTTAKVKHGADTDCDDYPTFIALIDNVADELKSKKLEKIRLGMSDYYDDIEIEETDYFMKNIGCLE